MVDRDGVCVLIPTYNEAETIDRVVASYRDQGFENVLVVDGGSDDGTREVAAEAGAHVVIQSGQGKGQAVREAVREHVEEPYVLMVDGDGTYLPSDAEAMTDPLDDGYDHVIGDRFADMRDGAMTRLNRAGNRLFNRAFAFIHGTDFGDILSGYRAFTLESFEEMTLSAEGFGIETEMAVECAKHRIETAVVPVTYLPRPSGSNTNLSPLRDGSIILLELYRRAKTNNPLVYFGSVGVVSAAVGVGIGLWVGFEWFFVGISHEVWAIVSAVGILFGVQLLMFGVLSDLIFSLHQEQMRRLERLEEE